MCANPRTKTRKASFAAIDGQTVTRPVMCATYISCGLNLWMRAQRAMPLFHEDVKSVMATFL